VAAVHGALAGALLGAMAVAVRLGSGRGRRGRGRRGVRGGRRHVDSRDNRRSGPAAASSRRAVAVRWGRHCRAPASSRGALSWFAEKATPRIPRSSRRRSPEAPAQPRESPQRWSQKALLLPVIPVYPRSARKRHDRPVTPEVAGSSPVAPVKIPANWHIVLSVQTPDLARLHRRVFDEGRNSQNRFETRRGVTISSRFRPRRHRPRTRRATTQNDRRSKLAVGIADPVACRSASSAAGSAFSST
jgi:hypothetical protein